MSRFPIPNAKKEKVWQLRDNFVRCLGKTEIKNNAKQNDKIVYFLND